VQAPARSSNTSIPGDEPLWILSDVVTEVKSVFVARFAPVSSPEQASQYVQCLIDNDKNVRSASHNIMAWRVKRDNGVSFQDCSQSAAGGCVLHLMQLIDLWNVIVVVSR
jgi:putative IMPACT (imprinted ancient) family translation regulator